MSLAPDHRDFAVDAADLSSQLAEAMTVACCDHRKCEAAILALAMEVQGLIDDLVAAGNAPDTVRAGVVNVGLIRVGIDRIRHFTPDSDAPGNPKNAA
jgi:hypothetical protein